MQAYEHRHFVVGGWSRNLLVHAISAGCVICQYASPEPPDDIIGGEREDFTQVVNDVRTGVRTDLGCASVNGV
jgi:hypothetical protein